MTKSPNVICGYCQIGFYRLPSKMKSKSGIYFCSREHQGKASRNEVGIIKSGPERTIPVGEKIPNGLKYCCLQCKTTISSTRKFCDKECSVLFYKTHPFKVCNQCNEEKELEGFHSSSNTLDGKNSRCKECLKLNYIKKYSRICETCNVNPIIKPSATRCKSCRGQERNMIAVSKTVKELGTQANHPDKIRGFARAMYKEQFLDCFECGYNQHVDICHIKDIYLFDGSSTIKEINSLDNLVALCKLHHWEFDNGFIFDGLDSSYKPQNKILKYATKLNFRK